jgi:hypothetical protein
MDWYWKLATMEGHPSEIYWEWWGRWWISLGRYRQYICRKTRIQAIIVTGWSIGVSELYRELYKNRIVPPSHLPSDMLDLQKWTISVLNPSCFYATSKRACIYELHLCLEGRGCACTVEIAPPVRDCIDRHASGAWLFNKIISHYTGHWKLFRVKGCWPT